MSPIESDLRVVLVALGAFVALLAVGAMRARRAVRWLGALAALATAAYAICTDPGRLSALAGWPVLFLCAALPAVFWAFARAWFDDEYAPGLDTVGAIALLGGLGLLAFGLRAGAPESAVALAALRRVLALALLAHLLWQLWRGARADLVDERLKARWALVSIGGLYTVGVLVTELWLADAQPPAWLQVANLSTICAIVALSGVAVTRWELRDPPPARAAAPAAPAEAKLIESLERAMREARLYRREGLSIAALAAHLGTQEHRLRRAINQGLGMRNFNEFLHGYRLEEVARRLRAPEDAHLPILTLALDAGYSSIGPFNRAFRARYGVTPTEYRGR